MTPRNQYQRCRWSPGRAAVARIVAKTATKNAVVGSITRNVARIIAENAARITVANGMRNDPTKEKKIGVNEMLSLGLTNGMGKSIASTTTKTGTKNGMRGTTTKFSKGDCYGFHRTHLSHRSRRR